MIVCIRAKALPSTPDVFGEKEKEGSGSAVHVFEIATEIPYYLIINNMHLRNAAVHFMRVHREMHRAPN